MWENECPFTGATAMGSWPQVPRHPRTPTFRFSSPASLHRSGHIQIGMEVAHWVLSARASGA